VLNDLCPTFVFGRFCWSNSTHTTSRTDPNHPACLCFLYVDLARGLRNYKNVASAFWIKVEKHFKTSLILSELFTFYVLIGFSFYFYGMENPGNGISFGVSDGELLQNGQLTEMGLRDSIKNIAGVVVVSALIQFFNVAYFVSRVLFEDGRDNGC
jgi:hypothetical protein